MLFRSEDLERAIIMHEEALRLTPSDHPMAEERQNSLARSLLARGRQDEVERAVEILRGHNLFLADNPGTSSVPIKELRSYGLVLDEELSGQFPYEDDDIYY